jgi:hypothetical protein
MEEEKITKIVFSPCNDFFAGFFIRKEKK